MNPLPQPAFNPLESPAEKYEAAMNELIGFLESVNGNLDQRSLRILLAATYNALYATGSPIWIWTSSPPRKLAAALGNAFGSHLFNPPANLIARELCEDTQKPLWILDGQGGMFHRPLPEAEFSVRQLAALGTGKYAWRGSKGFEPDDPDPEAFDWEGRLTVIACTRPLDRLQAARCNAAWPIVENTFVNLRFSGALWGRKENINLHEKWTGNEEFIFARIKLMLRNILDPDFRNRRHRAKMQAGLFESLNYLGVIVAAMRGAAYDTGLLIHRAVQLAMAHACMMGKESADAEDLMLARKVMLDAIPAMSLRVLAALPLDGYISLRKLQDALHSQNEAIELTLANLLITGALYEKRANLTHRPWYYSLYSPSPELQAVLLAGVV